MKDPSPSESPMQTKHCVITGAPCSGKTTVIEGLARRGYQVVAEVARAYIDSQRRLGRTLDEIKADILNFERRILLDKVRFEKALPKNQIVFLDRAIPDSIAYYQIEGLDWKEPLQYSRTVRYHRIFLFDRLAFEKDGVRSENLSLAKQIETHLEKCYLELGYPVIRVPAQPVDQRIDFVLTRIG